MIENLVEFTNHLLRWKVARWGSRNRIEEPYKSRLKCPLLSVKTFLPFSRSREDPRKEKPMLLSREFNLLHLQNLYDSLRIIEINGEHFQTGKCPACRMVQSRSPMNQEYRSRFEWDLIAIPYEVENFSTFEKYFGFLWKFISHRFLP